jgi:hypothetical protein
MSFCPGGERGNLGISRILFETTSMVEGRIKEKPEPASLPAFALCPSGSKHIFGWLWALVHVEWFMVASLEYTE